MTPNTQPEPDVHALAKALATQLNVLARHRLGAWWRCENLSTDGRLMPTAHITRSDGLELLVSASYNLAGRFKFSVTVPRVWRAGGGWYPSHRSPQPHPITVSQASPLSRIAREVTRRLLSKADPWFEAEKARHAEVESYEALTRSTFDRLKAATGHHPTPTRDTNKWLWLEGALLEAQGDQVRFEHLTLHIDLAEKVIELLLGDPQCGP